MCFSLNWLMNILIWLVVIGAVVALVRLLLPLVLTQLGAIGGTVMAVINILVWAFVVIVLIYFVFEVIGCLLGHASLPRHW